LVGSDAEVDKKEQYKVATKPKLLLAVMSCRTFRDNRVSSQRATWLKDSHPDIDVRFFYGRECSFKDWKDDEVKLDCPDDYVNFPLKVQAMFQWALDHGYDWVCKTDDDTYGVLDRLATAYPQRDGIHYAGRVRGPSGEKPAPYASGFCYWLDRRAMTVVTSTKWDYDVAEDRWVANVLFHAQIFPEPDYRYMVVNSKRNAISGKEGPRYNNGVVLSCEYETPEMMQIAHTQFLTLPSERPTMSIPDGSLSRVTVLIKTFMRDGYLTQCLNSLEPNYRSAKFLIVDDGWHEKAKYMRYSDLRLYGHDIVVMPFDSGFGAKSNQLLSRLDREFVLIGSDDFNFTPESRLGVEKMLKVMDARPELGFVGGHVDSRPYEGFFDEKDGILREYRIDWPSVQYRMEGGVPHADVDLSVNWGLLRAKVLKTVHWCPEWKIGGDHFMLFDAMKRAGWKTAVVPTADITTFPNVPSWKLTDYDKMRGRAWEALPGFFKHRGISKYVLFDGSVDSLEGDVLRHYLPNGRVSREVAVTPENSTVKCDVCGYRRTL
jgi:hypothetical protein